MVFSGRFSLLGPIEALLCRNHREGSHACTHTKHRRFLQGRIYHHSVKIHKTRIQLMVFHMDAILKVSNRTSCFLQSTASEVENEYTLRI